MARGIPCLRYGEIYTTYQDTIDNLQSHVSVEVASNATPLAYGDIVFAASGETRAEIGKAVAWLGHGQAVSGGDTVLLRDHGQFCSNPANFGPSNRETRRPPRSREAPKTGVDSDTPAIRIQEGNRPILV